MHFIFEVHIHPGYTVEQYAEAWVRASRIIQQTQGASGTRLHRKIGDPRVLLAIATWETKRARDAMEASQLEVVKTIIAEQEPFIDIHLIGEFEAPQWQVLPEPSGVGETLVDVPSAADRRTQVHDIVIEHVEAENARDLPRVLATYSEDCLFDDVPAGVIFRGRDSIGASYVERFEAYPGLDRVITRLTVGEDSAVVEITMKGAQELPYRGFPPRGDGYSELKIVGHFEVNAQGLISSETAYYDQLTAMVQLGALPDLGRTRGRIWLLLAYPFALVRMVRARFMH